MNGSIKRLVRDRGFGFILSDDGREYFFHSTGLQNAQFDSLQEQDPVSFEASPDTKKGLRAEQVRVT